MSIDTGDSAFPKTGSYHETGNACYDSENQNGMTLRDYFAAKAMQATISTAAEPCMGGLDGYEDHMARAAYKIADAMIRARNHSSESP